MRLARAEVVRLIHLQIGEERHLPSQRRVGLEGSLKLLDRLVPVHPQAEEHGDEPHRRLAIGLRQRNTGLHLLQERQADGDATSTAEQSASRENFSHCWAPSEVRIVLKSWLMATASTMS